MTATLPSDSSGRGKYWYFKATDRHDTCARHSAAKSVACRNTALSRCHAPAALLSCRPSKVRDPWARADDVEGRLQGCRGDGRWPCIPWRLLAGGDLPSMAVGIEHSLYVRSMGCECAGAWSYGRRWLHMRSSLWFDRGGGHARALLCYGAVQHALPVICLSYTCKQQQCGLLLIFPTHNIVVTSRQSDIRALRLSCRWRCIAASHR